METVTKEFDGDLLVVRFGNRAVATYNAFDLGCDWVRFGRESFARHYGFDWDLKANEELYDRCVRKIFNIGS